MVIIQPILYLCKYWANAPYIVCCDGGADAYIDRGNVPDVIIGDGDSLSEENRRKYSHILHCVSDQETNDQTKAVNFLLSQGKKEHRYRRSHRQTGRPYFRKYQPAH